MRNPIGELGPQVILPMKYLDEVKYAPTSLFSFVLFSEKVGPRDHDVPGHLDLSTESFAVGQPLTWDRFSS